MSLETIGLLIETALTLGAAAVVILAGLAVYALYRLARAAWDYAARTARISRSLDQWTAAGGRGEPDLRGVMRLYDAVNQARKEES
ncbi:hypothetical protein [Streptomyces sp. NPDC059786]|uniref:hypothetical protein n=1 Tax=Streptomyces sp. NPDC059786 TaxID=3346946 RepID=UPI00365F719A